MSPRKLLYNLPQIHRLECFHLAISKHDLDLVHFIYWIIVNTLESLVGCLMARSIKTDSPTRTAVTSFLEEQSPSKPSIIQKGRGRIGWFSSLVWSVCSHQLEWNDDWTIKNHSGSILKGFRWANIWIVTWLRIWIFTWSRFASGRCHCVMKSLNALSAKNFQFDCIILISGWTSVAHSNSFRDLFLCRLEDMVLSNS